MPDLSGFRNLTGLTDKAIIQQAGFHSEQISLEGFTSGPYIYEVELNNTWRQQSTMMLIK